MKEYSILIIDDDVEVIQVIIDLLETENPNYNFYKSTEAKLGIRIAISRQPDLIITDWYMPEMSGVDVIKHLKSNAITAKIPVVMLTGVMTQAKDLRIALEAGAIDYIRKPIDEVELMARVNSMLKFADSYNELIALKDRELASISLSLTQKSKLIQEVINKLNLIRNELEEDKEKVRGELRKLVQDISEETRDDSWASFKTYFDNVHPSFFQRLIELFPDLTPAEMRLAAFLRLNLSSKEIASILFITPDSVKTARNRLRKKMNLSPDENLNRFLIHI